MTQINFMVNFVFAGFRDSDKLNIVVKTIIT